VVSQSDVLDTQRKIDKQHAMRFIECYLIPQGPEVHKVIDDVVNYVYTGDQPEGLDLRSELAQATLDSMRFWSKRLDPEMQDRIMEALDSPIYVEPSTD
jgi:hypothetical protein